MRLAIGLRFIIRDEASYFETKTPCMIKVLFGLTSLSLSNDISTLRLFGRAYRINL